LFRGRHFEDVIILLCVRWYLRYSLTYRDLEEIMAERGLSVDHVTIWRWVQRYAPVLNQRMRREIRRPNRSWRVDETYVKVAGSWAYLYRAVDSAGETIEFMLSPKRDLIAAKLFLRLALSTGGPRPRVINVDGHPAYASAIAELKQSGELGRRCRCRTAPYLNNVIEQDHRFIKKRITASLEDSDRSRVLAERSKVTRRCMQSVKVRSAGWRKTTPSPNASSSTRSSASPHSSHRACDPPYIHPRYLQHNRRSRSMQNL